ncbi:OB-fold nucleic acid binding domain-containing protein [Candidatus Woesebacteria bacterium]|nr:OB-fold nucleic acid binding domain-containing protein [Candidatus Woesebacteria bacterium]
MASRLEEMMQARRDVREDMLQNGTNPYPQEGHRTHTNQQALDLADGKKATIAGRVRAMRGHGKIRFVDVHDEFTKIQVVFKQDETADFAAIKNFHTGDFIRVTGERFTTNAGEASLLRASSTCFPKRSARCQIPGTAFLTKRNAIAVVRST